MSASAATALDQELFRLAERIAAENGVELVDLVLRGAGGLRVVRVDIDRPGAEGVGIEDCKRVSQGLGIALDETDLVPYRYTLEVSSPGADRPIRTPDDIRRNTGRRVRVTERDPASAEGTTREYRGLLRGMEDDCLIIEGDGGEAVHIPLSRMVGARQDLEM